MKPKLLIVSQMQFGYLTDYFKYVQYLKGDFEITFYCWNYGREKIYVDGVSVVYIGRHGNILKRNLRFIYGLIRISKERLFTLYFVGYFRGCSVLTFISKKTPKILDIRTSCIHPSKVQRILQNLLIYFESLLYKKITIISRGLSNFLHISEKKIVELSLGADLIFVNPKVYDKVKLIYVGTLHLRRIEDTIIGFKKFMQKSNLKDATYTIIGTGWGDEEQKLKELVTSLNLENNVFVLGYIRFESLIKYFDKATIGVSYIPITPYYQFQPPTKTFEYLQAGLPVIATNTFENAKIINDNNGCLITDNPDSFSEGIEKIVNNFIRFNTNDIQNSVKEFTWPNICSILRETLIANISNSKFIHAH